MDSQTPFTMSNFDEIIGTVYTFIILIAIFALELILIILRFKPCMSRWIVGILVSLLIAVISLPSIIMNIQIQMHSQHSEPAILAIGFVVALFLLVVISFWRLLVYGAGASYWQTSHEGGYVLFDAKRLNHRGRDGFWWHVGLSTLIGCIMGITTWLTFLMFGVGLSGLLEGQHQAVTDSGALESMPLWLRIVGTLSLVTAAAIAEELAFRGLLLPWFAKILGWRAGHQLPFLLATIIVSMLWALIHFPNTNMPFIKIVQIFMIGVAFCYMAKKWGVECAIIGHAALNMSAMIAFE